MTRRTKQLFSLSLLDLLTSALGAVIFLFIITPKGGESPAQVRQASVYFDTTQMKIYGDLPDSLLWKNAGDTLLSVLVAYKDLPRPKPEKPERKYVYNEPRVKPTPKKEKPVNQAPQTKPKPSPPAAPKPQTKPTTPNPPKPQPKPQPAPPDPKPSKPNYRGDAPSVPCAVSFEINWPNKEDNVDLFVCRGSDCVYGARKKNKKVGQWDSGKSRNRIFGNDLRTNQEAVRQFDRIIPGEYKIYAQFKDSKRGANSVKINGLIYTKNKAGEERGEAFSRTLQKSKSRIPLGTIILKADGSYTFRKP